MNANSGLLLDYLRLILYPLTILAYVMIGANEYTSTRNWRRMVVLLGTIILLSFLFAMSLLGLVGATPIELDNIKDVALSPIILFMCVATWSYILRKAR